jgi:5-formyltetrahydrofolate cyclo-ligase
MPLTKTIFREKCIKKIQNASQHNKIYKKYRVNQQLMEFLKDLKGKHILFFYPLRSEPNIKMTLAKMRKNNHIYIPFMEGESFKMVPFRMPLKKKKFGIFEAGNTIKKIKKIDIAIVPIIGLDGNFQRIGFGKGMYDRFFEKLKKKPYTIFVQEEFCHTEEFICDSYDISCDVVITPKIIRKNSCIRRGK